MIKYKDKTFFVHYKFLKELFFIGIISLSSIIFSFNESFAQGRRDLGVYPGFGYQLSDSIRNLIGDSIGISSDTSRFFPADSSARLKYFHYIPEYSYGTKFKDKSHPLLLENSSSIKLEVVFSEDNKVIIRQTFAGEEIKAPLVLSLEDYLSQLEKTNEKRVFNDLFNEKFKGLTADDLTQLFEKFTDITVPLPFKTETIFGPPTFNLRINGAIDITASYQNVKSDQSLVSFNDNTQNNINFKQEVQVTAKGTIGDKLTIDADWNTQRVFDFENQLKIKYTGYADEVIQKIEAGNVSLDTKSSLIQSNQALFGVKGEFKLGPLTLSSVVSQKKSKTEEKDYAGGTSEQNFQINVYDYSDNHYFFDTLYKSSFLEVYNDSIGGNYSFNTQSNQVLVNNVDFEVWVQCDYTVQDKRFAVAYTMLGARNEVPYDTLIKTDEIPGIRFFGYFRKLSANEYFVDDFGGYISLKTSVDPNYAIGVTYSTFGQKKYGKGLSESTGTDTLILKMVKCKNQSPDITPLAWELKMKNVYRLPVSKVVEDGFTFDVMYNDQNVYKPNLPNQSRSLNQMLLIDRYQGKERRGPPDGKFDFIDGKTINRETGDIIFPTLRPFFDNLVQANVDTSFIFYEIYTQKKNLTLSSPKNSLYAIKGSARGEAGISNTINLGLNVVQGSVQVLLGSAALTENIDYTVDYTTGTVVIRNSAALTAKDLKIKYETNDLFTLASKTFLGLRGDYKVSDKTNLGFTFVNLRQETLNDKVRIGEEPTNNSMFGLDLTTELKPKFLTKLINILPGYNTKEESVFNLRGEVAYISPDPNTKKSQIPQDNNEAIAYVDDMEGAKKIVSLGTNFASWTISSLPVDSTIGSTDSVKQDKRANLRWYNISNGEDVKKIYPQRDVQAGQDKLTPFYLAYDPSKRGAYNYNDLNFDSVNKSTNWNGIMKYLNTTSTDLINENINYIEFNMQITNLQNVSLTNSKIVIDIGTISEDAIPNRRMDTEDRNRNGILEEVEDIGLDDKTDAEELILYNQRNNTNYQSLAEYPGVDKDPALDNNSPNKTLNYNVINGTQGNSFIEGGLRPDTEDLNRNGTLDQTNAYFSYEVSLDTVNNNRISGRGDPNFHWFQYRVPLSEYTKKVNNATLTNVEYVRVWITGVDGKIQLAFVDFNLVGNQWYKPNKNDTTYNISVVSIEENPQIYMSPVAGDILRQTVRNQNGVNTKSNEQSLSMNVSNLIAGQAKIAVKDYRNQVLDLFNYKVMKLFVNGDPSFNYTNEYIYDATMIVRFGTDSTNYYEYRAPIHPDVRPGQPWNSLNEVSIVFADLTSLKVSRDSSSQIVDLPVPNGPPGSYYRIRGTPALNAIREFAVGVEKNRTGLNAIITGSVWFNEIRVLKVNDEPGYAFNVNSSLKIADFANLAFNISKVDPNFHSIDTRVGSRNTGINWDFSASINVHKILNNLLVSLFSPEWKEFLNIPLTIRHSENLLNPKYYPGTDIEIDRAAQEKYRQVLSKTNNEELARQESEDLRTSSQSLQVRNEISVSGMTIKFPGNFYLIKNIVNAFSFNFAGSFGSQRDITFARKTDFAINGSVNFNTDFQLAEVLNLNIGKFIPLGDQYKGGKFYFFAPFLPLVPLFSSNFSALIDFNRTRNESRQRNFINDDPTGRLFRANRGFSFNWKFIENWIVDLSGTYSFKAGSDLTALETDTAGKQRSEKDILNDIFLNNGLINFGNDLDYTQTTTFNPRFNIPIINKFLDLTLNYNVTYGWTNPNTSQFNGYNVGYTNSINTGATFKFFEFLNTIGLGKSGDNRIKNGLIGAGKNNLKDDNPGLGDLLKLIGTFIPDMINLTYSQTSSIANPGVNGRPGFANFWLLPTYNEDYGPSRSYQLGWSQNPGKRVGGLNITDVSNINNNLTFNATITPLIPQSIRMNLSFKTIWGDNNTNTFTSLQDGSIGPSINRTSSLNKGYSIFFAGDVKNFRHSALTDPYENAQSISDEFKKNIASFPFPNWSLTISGLEKLPLLSEIATSVTFENTFTSEYSEASSTDITQRATIQRQSVTQSFNPLIGLNITFKELLGGSMSANLRINSSKSNILTPSSNFIQSTKTSDWSINANYSKAGFEIPLFGLSLKNDITFSLTISKNTNEPIDYRFEPGDDTPKPLPGNGSIVTTFNPSIQYSLSSKVQMQLFYKYIKTEPIEGIVTVVPRTSNEGGLNVRISIQ